MQNNISTGKAFFKTVLVLFIICNFFIVKNLLLGLHFDFNVSVFFLGLSIFIPLLINIRKKHFFLFEPKNIIPLWFSFMYYISSIPIYSILDSRNYFNTLLFDPLNRDNIIVYYALSVGILLFNFGYNLVNILLNKKYPMSRTINLPKIIGFKNVFIKLYVFSISFRFFGYIFGFLGSLSAIHGSGNSLNIPFLPVFYFFANSWIIYFFYFAALSFFSKKTRIYFLFFLFFEFFFMLISGHRRNLVIMFFSYTLAFYLVKNYLPIFRYVKSFGPIIIFVLPFITIYGYLLPSLDNYELSSLVNLVSKSFFLLKETSFSTMIFDFFLNPLLESFGYFSNIGIAYTEFSLKGEFWGPVGPQNLLDKIIPRSISSSTFNEREYYQIFAQKAMSYNIDYSNLTFTAQSEQMLSFGIPGVLLGMLSQGMISCYLFRRFNSIKTPFVLRVIFLGLLYKFTINFCSGLLVSDLVFPFRLLFYSVFIYSIYRMIFLKKTL